VSFEILYAKSVKKDINKIQDKNTKKNKKSYRKIKKLSECNKYKISKITSSSRL